jgi:hypothetical protein
VSSSASAPAARSVTLANRGTPCTGYFRFGSMGTGLSLARHQRDLGEQVHRIMCPSRASLMPTAGQTDFTNAWEPSQSPRYERASALSCMSVAASPWPTILPRESR